MTTEAWFNVPKSLSHTTKPGYPRNQDDLAVLAFDMDGPLANCVGMLQKILTDMLGTPIGYPQKYRFRENPQVTEEVERRALAILWAGYVREIEPVANARDVINALAMAFEIHVVTARPQNVELDTKWWLRCHGFHVDQVHVTGNWHDKPRILKDIKARLYLDDHPEATGQIAQEMKFANPNCVVAVYDAPYNQSVVTNKTGSNGNPLRVKGWNQVFQLVQLMQGRQVADCTPACPIYYCPTSGEDECPNHGGFDVCCDQPETHLPRKQ